MDRREKKFLIAVFLLSLLLKLAYGYLFENRFQPQKYDLSPHEAMASNFANGRGLVYDMQINDRLTITRYYEDELPYPLLAGIIYKMTNHNIKAMLLLQVFYTSFIPIFIYLLAKYLFDINAAKIAAVLSAMTPGIIVYAVSKIHSMTFYSLIFCISLWACLRYIKKQDAKNAALLGLMLGMGILSRNSFILFIPLLFIYLFYTRNMNLQSFLKIYAAIIIILTPLVIRNYIVYNKIVISKPGVAWPAMNPKATGTLYQTDDSFSFIDVNKELFSGYKNLTDLEYAKTINEAVVSNIKKDKLGYTVLSLKRFYYFWWFSPSSGREYPGSYLIYYKAYYLFIMLLAVFGVIVLFIRSGALSWNNYWILPIIFIVAISVPHYLYYSEGRHRFAIEPIILIFTGYGISYLYHKIFKRAGLI